MHIPFLLGPLLVLTPRAPAATTNYEQYAGCAKQCLQDNALGSGCSFTSDPVLVACLCASAPFAVSFAQCINKDCGAAALAAAAPIYIYNCNITGNPSAASEQQFIADGTPEGVGTASLAVVAPTAAPGVTSTTPPPAVSTANSSSPNLTSASPKSSSSQPGAGGSATTSASLSPSPSQSSSSSNNSGNSTLSTASLIGTIIGSVAGAVGSIFGAVLAYKKYKKDKKKEKEEAAANGAHATRFRGA